MSEGSEEQLPPGWIQTNLADVVEVLDGQRVPINAKDRAKRLGDVPYYGATGRVGWIDDFLFDETLVLLGEDGAPFFDKMRQVSYVVSGKSWVNNHAHVMRAAAGINSSLLSHQLNTVDYHPFVSGTTRWKLNQAPMRRIPLRVLPVGEQSRVADVLDELFSELDAAVAALERVRDKLKLYRASVLKAAVEGALTAEWRAQHPIVEPASELLDRILAERRGLWEGGQLAKFKATGQEPPKNWKAKYGAPGACSSTNRPLVPDGWCWVTFDHLAWSLRSGVSETSGREVTDYPVLKSSAVRHGAIDFDDLNYLQEAQSSRPENFLRRGDFLITRLSGSVDYVGCSAAVRDVACENIQYPDRVFCAKLIGTAHRTYVSYCFQHSRIRRAVEEAAKSTAGHQRISMSDIYPLVLPLPPLAEQEAIVELVEDQMSVIDHLETDIEAKLKSAQSLRQAILRHAFSGKLVPQDPKDEPASELLKRIAVEREARDREADSIKGKKPRRTVPRRKA